MAKLPTAIKPKYTLDLPLSNKQIKFSPFNGADEKVLILANTEGDDEQKRDAVFDVINKCTESLDYSEVEMAEIEYLFINMIARSINDKIIHTFRCGCQGEDYEKDDVNFTVAFDLYEASVTKPDETEISVTIDTDAGPYVIQMMYPKADQLLKTASIKSMIKSIHSKDGEIVFDMDELSTEEVEEFVNSTTGKQRRPIMEFMQKIPTVKATATGRCRKCKKTHTIHKEGLRDFFPSSSLQTL